ncbi:MAG: GNAT family N-acetyltransferase, partial [Streptosporangiaceae bacterium]
MSTAQDAGRVYALLADGTTAEIRQARPGDFDAVRAMHEAMAPDNIYLRFFSYSRRSAETEARRICRDPAPGSAALLALIDGELAGVASYAGLTGHPGQAEVAFAVADHMHHKGIATLLLEHLVALARSREVTTFTAETLTENTAMLEVFAGAGLPVRRHRAGEVCELTFPLPR